jgi:hypothetical protein
MENAKELLTSFQSGLTVPGAEASEHLTSEKLAAYVDESLSEIDKEVAEYHLTVCQSCEREARALRDFKETISPQLNERYEPTASQPSRPKSRRSPISVLWPRALSGNSWRTAFAAAAVLFLMVGSAWLIWKLRSNESRQVAQEETPAATPTAPFTVNGADPNTNVGNSSQPDALPTETPEEGGANILLALNDGGGRVTLDAEGNLSGMEPLAPAQAEAVRDALRTQRVVNPAALTGIGARGGVLRGGKGQSGETFFVRSPVGAVVETARPTLRWDALKDATYMVTIYDSNFTPVATSRALVSPSWTPPVPLARGRVYSWQVTALKQDSQIKSPQPPAPEAKFKVLEGPKAAEIQRARRANPNSHLALGVLYAQAGLLDEAEREFGALVRANPKSEVARKLLHNVRNARNVR